MEPCAPADAAALWPRWIAPVFAAVGIALGVAVALESRPVYPVWVRVALSAVPAVVWASCIAPKRPPFFVTGPVVFAAVALLLVHPAQFDAAPFFLVLLIADAESEGPFAAAAVAVCSAALLVALEIAGRFQGSVVWVLAFAFTWAGTALIRSRLRMLDVVRERAVVEERQRIARELHDVVAHSLAVTMLQLTGARLALERDPEDAARALAEAERAGRESMAEIRRAVGLLAPGDSAPVAALPTAVDVPALVQEMQDAGLDVRLRCEGDLTTVGAAPGLALYRIAQESLANVVKHAPGACAAVAVVVDDGLVRVEVVNHTVASAAIGNEPQHRGMGLRSMRDRIESLGGTFAAGADGTNWQVAATIPRARMSVRVLLVDDQPLVREGLRRILHPSEGFEVVGECADGDDVEHAVTTLRPDVVVLDIRMRHVDGIEAVRRLRRRGDTTPVLVLTTFDDDEYVSGALRAGASGFQLKDAPGEELIHAVRAVAEGEGWLDPAVTARVLETYRCSGTPDDTARVRLEQLTAKEREVLERMATGATNAEIAEQLIVSEATVKSHIGHIFTKLDLRDRAAAIVFAFDNGVVDPRRG